MIAATQLKVGNIIMHNGKPHRVTNVLHVTPGNWRGMVQTRLVNIETGSNTEHRFRSEDKVERANMEQHSLQFSYRAGDSFHFMNTESYEMIDLPADVLGEAVNYLVEGMILTADYFEGRVVGVEVPMFVELAVKDMVYVASALYESGADGINFDTTGAAGDPDFLATLRATKILKEKYPDLCIELGMAGEFILGMHGVMQFEGVR